MKKRLLIMMLALSVSATVFSGCGDSDNSSRREERQESKKDKDDKKEKKKDKDKDKDKEDDLDPDNIEVSDKESTVYKGTVEVKEEDYESKQDYTLNINEDGSFELFETYNYTDNYNITYYYAGAWEESEEGFSLIYDEEDGSFINFLVTLEGDEIVKVEEKYDDVDFTEIVGTYTCDTKEYGAVELTIDEEGNATFVCDECTLEGYVMQIDDRWDVMVSSNDESEDIYIDWFVDFNGDEFTYQTYTGALYGKYEGEYEMSGELGNITIAVDGDGMASSTIKLDGKSIDFTGSIYADDGEYSGNYMTVYLDATESAYSLYLEVFEEQGAYSYSGTVTYTMDKES